MQSASRPDPVRETLVDILRQLNQAETRHEGQEPEQALELQEIVDRLASQRIPRKQAAVASALGLLVRNDLVRQVGTGAYSWQRQRQTRPRYQITPDGKKWLVEALESANRVR